MRPAGSTGRAFASGGRWIISELHSSGTRHAAVTFAGYSAQIGLGLATSVLVARTLGPADYGLLALIGVAVLAVDTLGDFGLTAAAVRSISRSWTSAHVQARRLVHGYVGLAILANLLAAAAGVVLAGPIARLALGRPEMEVYLRVALLGLASTALNGLVVTLLQALSRFGNLAAIQVLTSASYLLGLLVLAAVGHLDVWTAVILGVLNPLVGFVVGLKLLPGGLISPGEVLARASRSTWGELAAFGRWVWVSSLLIVPASRLDVLMVSHWAPASSVGAYALALNLALRIDVVSRTRHTTLSPVASALRTRYETAAYIRSTLGRSVFLSIPFIVAAPLAGPFIEMLYGTSYAAAVPAFRILLVAVVLDVALTPFLLLAYPLNAPKVLAAADGARVASLALLGVLLIPGGGSTGAALAKLGAVIVGAVIALVALWHTDAARALLSRGSAGLPLAASQDPHEGR